MGREICRTECLKGNFESRTPLTNRNLAGRNTGFGDGSLSSAPADNGVETIQGGPKRDKRMVKK